VVYSKAHGLYQLPGGKTMKLTKIISTKMFADDDAHGTELTIDFTGLSPADIMEVAAQAAVVKWQSNARRLKAIPAIATYHVPKPGTRQAVALTPESLVAKYGSVEAAIAALEALKKA